MHVTSVLIKDYEVNPLNVIYIVIYIDLYSESNTCVKPKHNPHKNNIFNKKLFRLFSDLNYEAHPHNIGGMA